MIIMFLVIFLFVNYLSFAIRNYNGELFSIFSYIEDNPSYLLSAFPISFNTTDLVISLFSGAALVMIYVDKKSQKKNFRANESHGSASWGDPVKELKGMYDANCFENNVIYSTNTRLALVDKNVQAKFRRNKNTCIVGGSGSGKTRFYLKPNIMQMNADYVVTDPKGTVLNEVGTMLVKKGNYSLRILNLVDISKSMKYNPFKYIKSETDILKVVDTIIKNTSGGKDVKEDFWVKAERLLYQAYISLILDYFPEDEKHIGTVLDLLELSVTKENDENYKNAIDEMFDNISEESPNAFCVKQYKAFKLAAGETTKSILISCATRLAPINIPQIRDLMSSDEMDIDKLGSNSTPMALFCVIPDTDSTFNFIVSIMYTQMFNLLCTKADTEYGGVLPRHVSFKGDEFANCGVIPNFQILIATIRSRNISADILVQTLSQLKALYKDSWETIVGNCDTLLFLGGKEESTLKMISNQLGKETIDDYNVSTTRSDKNSYGQNYSKLGRELLTPDELQRMDRSKCIVMIQGKRPFFDDKFDIEKHKMFKYHANSIDSRLWFDESKYIRRHRRLLESGQELAKSA